MYVCDIKTIISHHVAFQNIHLHVLIILFWLFTCRWCHVAWKTSQFTNIIRHRWDRWQLKTNQRSLHKASRAWERQVCTCVFVLICICVVVLYYVLYIMCGTYLIVQYPIYSCSSGCSICKSFWKRFHQTLLIFLCLLSTYNDYFHLIG